MARTKKKQTDEYMRELGSRGGRIRAAKLGPQGRRESALRAAKQHSALVKAGRKALGL